MKSLKDDDEYKGLLCLPVKDIFLNLTLWYWMCTFLTAYLLFMSLSKAWMHFQLLFDLLMGGIFFWSKYSDINLKGVFD